MTGAINTPPVQTDAAVSDTTASHTASDRHHWPAFPRLTPNADVRISADDRWPFPTYLDTSAADVAMLQRLYAQPRSCPKCVSPEAGLLLHALTHAVAPQRAIEIGAYLGVSTIWMAGAMARADHRAAGASLSSTDVFGSWPSANPRTMVTRSARLLRARSHVARAGLKDIARIRCGDAATLVDAVRTRAMTSADPAPLVDLAFIDGDHSFEGVRDDMLAIEPLLGRGSCVLFHDVFPDQCGCEGPRRLLDEMSRHVTGTYERCDLYTAPLNYGITVLRRLDGVERQPDQTQTTHCPHLLCESRVGMVLALARNTHASTVVCAGDVHADIVHAAASGISMAQQDPVHCHDAPSHPRVFSLGISPETRPQSSRTSGIVLMERLDAHDHIAHICTDTASLQRTLSTERTGIDLCVMRTTDTLPPTTIQRLMGLLNIGGTLLCLDASASTDADASGVAMQWCTLGRGVGAMKLGQRIG